MSEQADTDAVIAAALAAVHAASESAAVAVAAAAASAAAAVDQAAQRNSQIGVSLREMVVAHDVQLRTLPPGQKLWDLLEWVSEMKGAMLLMRFALGTSLLSAIVSIIAIAAYLTGK